MVFFLFSLRNGVILREPWSTRMNLKCHSKLLPMIVWLVRQLVSSLSKFRLAIYVCTQDLFFHSGSICVLIFFGGYLVEYAKIIGIKRKFRHNCLWFWNNQKQLLSIYKFQRFVLTDVNSTFLEQFDLFVAFPLWSTPWFRPDIIWLSIMKTKSVSSVLTFILM